MARDARSATIINPSLDFPPATAPDLLERCLGEVSDGRGVDLPYALNRLLEAFLAIDGLAGESMVRDVGWRLMQVGKRIERSQHVVAAFGAASPRRRTRARRWLASLKSH